MKNICNSDTIVDNKKIDLTELDNIKTYLVDKYSINSKNQKKIFIYGCSHCKCFTRDKIELEKLSIENMWKSAASMSGIVKDISTLNYKPIIDKNI